jgi:phage terminase large subunit GpA-like protein
MTLKPRPRLTLVEWADQYRQLSSESSSQPGKWSTSKVEAARGPMLAATDPHVRKVTVMCSTQMLKTSLLENIIGYYIHLEPSPILVVQPTVSLAETFSKDRLDKMLRDTPVLRGIVGEKKSRDSGNTVSHKQFPGGFVALVGANSPVDLASRPIRIALLDEVDKYPESAGKEGDPVRLVEERTATFRDSAKIVTVCSPTIEGRSRIEQDYVNGDRRVYCAPCPHCGEAEELLWDNVKWENDDPETARYVCPKCKSGWTEIERLKAIGKGFYRATAPFTGHASFKVNKLASPWEPLSVLVRKYLESKDHPEKLKTFYNTQLAETWVEKGEAPDYQRLYERRELYAQNVLPEGVVFLTAGADVQKDRIEVEIVGWGRDKQSWSIDFRVLMGETAGEDVWNELSALLGEIWQTSTGQDLTIRMLAVDTGYNTQYVYNWVRKQAPDRVRAVKGSDSAQTIFGTPKDVDIARDGSKLKRAIKLWPVGVSVVKSELYGWLRLDKPEDGHAHPPGYCHFPQYDLEHFKRLCSEHYMKRTVNGRTAYRWEKMYERNEQLDCRVYARAAASMFGLDRFTSKDFDVLAGKFEAPRPKPNVSERKLEPNEPNKQTPKPTSSYWDRQNRKPYW